MASQGVRIQEERIEAAKTWLERQSVRDIQVFIGFANFYRRFIQRFSMIAAPLTSMLKTSPEATRSKSMEGRERNLIAFSGCMPDGRQVNGGDG